MNRTITVAPVRKTVRVNAAAAHAFETFAAGIGRWWPATHTVGTSPMRDVVIEPRAGGRWYERGQDGSECDWGVVLAWEPPGRLLLGWQLDAEFRRNPATASEVELRFIAESPTVTRVELSSDLSAGKIFYSVLGSAGDKSKAAHMLESAAGFIQRKVARVLDLRRVPHLRWVYDESLEAAARLDDRIRAALERDRRIQAEGHAPPPEDDWEAEYDRFAAGQGPPDAES